MILLRSFDKHGDFAEFYVDTGEFTKLSKEANPDLWERGNFDGQFSEVKNNLFVLYTFNGKHFFKANDMVIELDENVEVKLNRTGWNHFIDYARDLFKIRYSFKLVNRQTENTLFLFGYLHSDVDEYTSKIPPFIRWIAYSAMEEPEHFDFFLYVYNLFRSRGI